MNYVMHGSVNEVLYGDSGDDWGFGQVQPRATRQDCDDGGNTQLDLSALVDTESDWLGLRFRDLGITSRDICQPIRLLIACNVIRGAPIR